MKQRMIKSKEEIQVTIEIKYQPTETKQLNIDSLHLMMVLILVLKYIINTFLYCNWIFQLRGCEVGIKNDPGCYIGDQAWI